MSDSTTTTPPASNKPAKPTAEKFDKSKFGYPPKRSKFEKLAASGAFSNEQLAALADAFGLSTKPTEADDDTEEQS
jgi:hypothetical protein